MKHARNLFALALTFALSSSALAENWPQWRGPHFNGSAEAKNLPATWTKDSVRWTTDLPGPSAATPIIWGNFVFISTADQQSRTLHALCLDRKTGRILWDKKTGDGIQRDGKSNFAAPSPVADAGRVFFFYSNGTLVAFDHEGNERWQRSITKDYGDFAFNWTFSSSPMLYNGRLYLQDLQRDVPVNGHGLKNGPIDSFLLAMDPATGKTLWRQVRPSKASAESHEAYSTPIPFEYQGRREILVAGGDCLTGHDADTGREIWRWGTWNPTRIGHWRLVPSPVPGDGVVLVCAPKMAPVYAIKAGLSGLLDDSAIAWTSEDNRQVSADVPTPLFYQDDFFVLSDVRKSLSRVDPKTGHAKWTVDLPGRGKFEASPTGADGKIYMINFKGEVVVASAADGKILATIPMGEPGDDMIRSTVSVADGELFIRTNHKVFCVGGKAL